MTWIRPTFAWMLPLLVLFAWGGCVMVDDATAGGTVGVGGAGGAPDAPDAAEICTKFCQAEGSCTADSLPCEPSCMADIENAGACASEVIAIYDCYTTRVTAESCGPPECDAAIAERDACSFPACHGTPPGGEVCFIVDDGCTVSCGGVDYVVSCPALPNDPSGTPQCTCSVGGEVVGTCTASTLDPFPWGSCCDPFFAASE